MRDINNIVGQLVGRRVDSKIVARAIDIVTVRECDTVDVESAQIVRVWNSDTLRGWAISLVDGFGYEPDWVKVTELNADGCPAFW